MRESAEKRTKALERLARKLGISTERIAVGGLMCTLHSRSLLFTPYDLEAVPVAGLEKRLIKLKQTVE